VEVVRRLGRCSRYSLPYPFDMADDLEKVVAQALKLPSEARAALAGKLIESLDPGVDEDAEETWSREIASRLVEAEGGTAKPVPWLDARRAILRRE
jgi:putative addiction module component (TIGR02574 family)